MHSDVVTNVLGLGTGDLQMEVTRAPLAGCERLILGNAILGSFRVEEGDAAALVDRFERECTRQHAYGAATIIDVSFSTG